MILTFENWRYIPSFGWVPRCGSGNNDSAVEYAMQYTLMRFAKAWKKLAKEAPDGT